MKNYPQLAARVLNTPLLVEPGYARVFFSALAGRLNIIQLEDAEGQILTGEKMRMSAEAYSGGPERQRPFQIVDGAAILPVSGSLVHKSGNLQPYSGTTGYDGIIARAAEAFADPDVKGVLMDNHTPGGEVSGCFDTARSLRQMADEAGKPLWSLCYDMNCSAGMALASAAHRRLITQTGVAGSVGVVMAHSSHEEWLKETGIEVTLIHSGAHKVDGNPYNNLSSEVLERFQASTDQLRQEFAQLVADHTGLSVEAVLATEAAVFRGQEAIEVGFADELVNGHEAIASFSEHLSTQGRTISIGATMSKQDVTTQAETSEQPSPAAGAEAPAAAEPAATVDAGVDMKARIQGITQCEEAQGREETANHLAFETDMSVEDAKKTLATIPLAATDASDMGTSLAAAMAAEKQPEIGADAESESAEQSEDQKVAASAVASWKQVKGLD